MKVSVITTLYNYRRYLDENMRSVLNQDFDGDIEHVIVDDHSEDRPKKTVRNYSSDRLTYIRLDRNYGYSYAKNIGIKAAKAPVLVMLDADDFLTKNSIRVRYEKLQDCDFVHGPALDLKSNKTMQRNRMWKRWKKCKDGLGCYRYVHAQGVMLRKEIHSKIGLYDPLLRSKSDREMFARIFNHGFKIGIVREDVVVYRRHSKQMHRSAEKIKQNDKLQRHVLRLIEQRKTDFNGLEMLEINNDPQTVA
jgi:glycosyltransferase involved in cell wall biosynthesis|tara:strand:- start:5396 stop:6142 length:747 start_codon:yes stop_codon:yes gene_type:complete